MQCGIGIISLYCNGTTRSDCIIDWCSFAADSYKSKDKRLKSNILPLFSLIKRNRYKIAVGLVNKCINMGKTLYELNVNRWDRRGGGGG